MPYGILRPNEHGRAWGAPLEFKFDGNRYEVKPEGSTFPLEIARHGLDHLTPKDPFEVLPPLVDLEAVYDNELTLQPAQKLVDEETGEEYATVEDLKAAIVARVKAQFSRRPKAKAAEAPEGETE